MKSFSTENRAISQPLSINKGVPQCHHPKDNVLGVASTWARIPGHVLSNHTHFMQFGQN